MRPLELEVEGFRSYDQRVVFDWRGRHLVGIVGPIGSGKSSILDAIAFALYGKTPVFERESKTLIHQQADQLRVRFDFAIEDVVWRVLRVVRRKSGSQHALYRIGGSSSEVGAGSIPEVEKERAVSARVEQLLGLDFAAFNRSVLLAQNRFARFLHAAPAERDRVLKGVFGFDRIDAMHSRAKARRDALETEVVGLEGERTGIGADARSLDTSKAQLDEADASLAVLEKASSAIADALIAEQEAARRIHHAVEQLGTIDEVDVRLPSDAQVDARHAAVTSAKAAAMAALTSREKADREARQAAADLETLGQRIGNRAQLAAARETVASLARVQARVRDERKNLTEARKRLTEADSRLREAIAERTAVTADEAARAEDVQTAIRVRRDAEAALRDAERDAITSSLAREIGAGDSCPVCGRTVDETPSVPDGDVQMKRTIGAEAALARARRDEESARQAAALAVGTAAAAREAVSGAEREVRGAKKALATAERRVRKAEAETRDLEVELTDRLGLGNPAERLEAIDDQLTRAEQAVELARQAADTAEADLEQARQSESEAKAAATRLAHRLANLAGSLGTDLGTDLGKELGSELGSGADPASEPDDLAALARQVRRALSDAQTAALAARAQAESDRRRARDERRQRISALGLDADTDIDAALATARRTRDRKHDEVTRLEAALKRAATLTERLDVARVELRRYRQLADDLTAPRFLRFLLDEERALLAELGSARFEMLSGGRYRFTDDGTFGVVDLANAEATRKAETLSGGETFLASLALALALAETVTGGGGRLDAFFLDEGFGALDDEHLDLAMDGIERLVADSPRRLVCIVSHVPTLRQRVDDLIVLDKDPVTGSSRVVRGASLDPS